MREIVITRMKNAKLQEKNKSARVKSKPRLSVGVSGMKVLKFFLIIPSVMSSQFSSIHIIWTN